MRPRLPGRDGGWGAIVLVGVIGTLLLSAGETRVAQWVGVCMLGAVTGFVIRYGGR